MFQNLSQRLTSVFDKLRGRGLLSEDDVNSALREIRIALLEADVSLPVVKDFVEQVRNRAIGQEVLRSVSPGQMVIKIVHDHLVELLGSTEVELNLATTPPASILMVGLQGSGKTTTSGKLAKHIHEKLKKRVLLVSLDIYRPAAQHQLEVLAQSLSVESLPIIESEKPLAIVARAIERARQGSIDVIIYDTAGRLHIDDMLMDEVKAIQAAPKPIEILLVADAMTGQDAVRIAQGFKDALPITGLVLTRIDGDSRGGAALSMRAVTGCPIKFLGVGEKSDHLEIFHPERLAGRILDMGDIVSLVERASEVVNVEDAEKMAKKMQKGIFDLNDMAQHIEQMLKMGGISNMMGFLPGMGKLKDKIAQSGMDDKVIRRQLGIIHSMTKKERKNVQILNASRRRRIAKGAGLEVSDVNRLLKQHQQMQLMMKQLGKTGAKGLISGKLGALFGN
ncbi:MAG: signal recognition particle protein [Alphaproteobacteria bacterium]|nr:signal recognition particle protein [Alphaproteobacteria bacterium]